MLRIVFVVVVMAHALIHVMGFSKAFSLASLEQLRAPITRPMGVLWLLAALLLMAACVLLVTAPRWFWLPAVVGVVASQVCIVGSWSDARFGTIVNLVVLLVAVYAAFAWGPFGLRSEYERAVREGLARLAEQAAPAVVSEADLAPLPRLVQRYLRGAGVVGAPKARGVRARMTGRIRSGAGAPWMPFVAEQHDFFDPPRRYFWMEASKAGVPAHGLHMYDERDATMRIRLLAIAPLVELAGPKLRRTETVTFFNDLCIFAPWTLVDPAIQWREVDSRSVEATYSNGGHTIHATLLFDEAGALVDFWSDDRGALSADGTLLAQRWSTPIREHRAMGRYRLATRGEGRYAAPEGEYSYLELAVVEVTALD